MEDKTVPLLHLTDIANARALARRRLSLLDLNLRQLAMVLLSPEEFAEWSGATVEPSEPSPLRSADVARGFASPRHRERRYTHLQLGSRSASMADRLSIPCKVPHFLGHEILALGLDGLSTTSQRSRSSRIIQRLSTFSPRGKDKVSSGATDSACRVAVVRALRGLLQLRQQWDRIVGIRSPISLDALADQVAQMQAGVLAVGASLECFSPASREAQDLRERLLQLVVWDSDLYAMVMPWVNRQRLGAIQVHAVDMANLLRSPLDDADVLLAAQYGLDADEAVAFRNAQWALSASRLPGRLNDRYLHEHPDGPWSKGGMTSVFRLVYQGDPELLVMVWKPEDPTAGSVASDLIGITCNDARGGTPSHCAGRSVATYQVSKRLGLGLVPKTEWAVHKGRLGTAMAMADGRAPSSKGPLNLPLNTQTAVALKACDGALLRLSRQFRFCSVEWSDQLDDCLVFDQYLLDCVYDPDGRCVVDRQGDRLRTKRRETVWVCQDFDSPSLRRQMIRLQWLDHLTGQVDRNPMNYLVAWADDGRAQVSAIDNDLSFPAVPEVPPPSGTNMIWLPYMPPLVDSEMAEAIAGLSDADWQQCLHGLVMPNEFQFACARLAAVKAKIRDLEAAGKVIGPTDQDWARSDVAHWLGLADIAQDIHAARNDEQLGELWLQACCHSYLRRDATKQAMVLAARDPIAYFDPAAIQSFICNELLTG